MHIFLFSFHSFSGYTGKVDNSTIDSQLAHTISHSFIFLHWKAEVTHTDSIEYIIYTHRHARNAPTLPYDRLTFYFFSLSVHPFPPITREWTAKTDVDTAKRDIDPAKTDGKTAR